MIIKQDNHCNKNINTYYYTILNNNNHILIFIILIEIFKCQLLINHRLNNIIILIK